MKANLKKLIAALTAAVMLTGCAGNASNAGNDENSGAGAFVSGSDSSAVSGAVDPEAPSAVGEAASGNTESTAPESGESDPPSESGNESGLPEDNSSAEQTAPPETAADTAESAPEGSEMNEEIKYIALTFDDGPNTTTTNEVLDKLEKYDITASFFLIGNNITDDSAKAVKRAYDMGCEINNHSRSHSNMTELSAEEIQAEYDYVDEKVFEITGEHTRFFRPPYIAVRQIMFDNIDAPFIAGIGANDWEERVTAEKRAKTILKQAKDGDIILLHDMEGNSATVEALDTIIPELQAQGYRFVTVSELFEAKGISPDMEKVYTNVTQQNMYN